MVALCAMVKNLVFGSNIYLINDGSNNNNNQVELECNGDRACSNAIIENGGTVYLNGHLSGANATLLSSVNDSSVSPNTDANYYFRGAYSGHNATIICDNNNNV